MSYNNTIEIQNRMSKMVNEYFAKDSANFTKETILSLNGSFKLAQTAKSFQDSYKDLLS